MKLKRLNELLMWLLNCYRSSDYKLKSLNVLFKRLLISLRTRGLRHKKRSVSF